MRLECGDDTGSVEVHARVEAFAFCACVLSGGGELGKRSGTMGGRFHVRLSEVEIVLGEDEDAMLVFLLVRVQMHSKHLSLLHGIVLSNGLYR